MFNLHIFIGLNRKGKEEKENGPKGIEPLPQNNPNQLNTATYNANGEGASAPTSAVGAENATQTSTSSSNRNGLIQSISSLSDNDKKAILEILSKKNES